MPVTIAFAQGFTRAWTRMDPPMDPSLRCTKSKLLAQKSPASSSPRTSPYLLTKNGALELLYDCFVTLKGGSLEQEMGQGLKFPQVLTQLPRGPRTEASPLRVMTKNRPTETKRSRSQIGFRHVSQWFCSTGTLDDCLPMLPQESGAIPKVHTPVSLPIARTVWNSKSGPRTHEALKK